MQYIEDEHSVYITSVSWSSTNQQEGWKGFSYFTFFRHMISNISILEEMVKE